MNPAHGERLAAPLVHIGYHKTGSTWLQDHLFSRADAGFTVPFNRKTVLQDALISPQPLMFDAAECKRLLRPAVDRLLAAGRIPVITSESLSGEINSGGWQAKEMADRIKSVFPDARILVVIREQKSMVLSSYAMYLRGHGLASLKDFLDPPRPALGQPFFSLDYLNYDRLIAYYQALFGRDRVLALPYELLAGRPEEFSGAILGFAGARPIGDLPYDARPKRMWPAFSVAFRRYTSPFFNRTVVNGYSWMCPDMRLLYVSNWFFWRGLNPHVPAFLDRPILRRWRRRIAGRLAGIYADSNARTAALIGRDLAALGYEVAAAAQVEAPVRELKIVGAR